MKTSQSLHWRQRVFLGLVPFCSPGTTSFANVSHDRWCESYRGGECNCTPDVEISFPSRRSIVIVDPLAGK